MPTWRQALAALLLSVSAPAVGVPAAGHDRAFWRRIVESRYQVPAGESADALVVELLRSRYVKLALRPPPGPEAVRREVLGTLEKLGP